MGIFYFKDNKNEIGIPTPTTQIKKGNFTYRLETTLHPSPMCPVSPEPPSFGPRSPISFHFPTSLFTRDPRAQCHLPVSQLHVSGTVLLASSWCSVSSARYI